MGWNESITTHNFYHPHCVSIIIGIKSSQTTFCRMTMMPHHGHHYVPVALDMTHNLLSSSLNQHLQTSPTRIITTIIISISISLRFIIIMFITF